MCIAGITTCIYTDDAFSAYPNATSQWYITNVVVVRGRTVLLDSSSITSNFGVVTTQSPSGFHPAAGSRWLTGLRSWVLCIGASACCREKCVIVMYHRMHKCEYLSAQVVDLIVVHGSAEELRLKVLCSLCSHCVHHLAEVLVSLLEPEVQYASAMVHP